MNAKQFVKNPNYYKEQKDKLATDLVNMITSEDAVWRKTWKPNPNENYIPTNCLTKDSYKGMNVWLLWGKSQSNIWGTMLAWRKLGYSVKGATSEKVHFFKPKQNLKIVNGVVQKDKNGDDEYYTTFLFKTHSVFKAEDVHSFKEGNPYPISTVEDTSHLDNSIKPIEKCKKFFDNLNAKLVYDGGKCFYRPSTDEIGMPKIEQFENAEEYYSVFAHEHIHWSGDDRRLKRNKVSYAEEELVAEIGSFLTSVHLGIQSTPKPNNLAYLKCWSKGEVNKFKIFSALSDASKSLEYLKEHQTKEVTNKDLLADKTKKGFIKKVA